jgi:hypothetical protein
LRNSILEFEEVSAFLSILEKQRISFLFERKTLKNKDCSEFLIRIEDLKHNLYQAIITNRDGRLDSDEFERLRLIDSQNAMIIWYINFRNSIHTFTSVHSKMKVINIVNTMKKDFQTIEDQFKTFEVLES